MDIKLRNDLLNAHNEFVEWTINNVRNYDDTDFTFDKFMDWVRNFSNIKN